MLTSASQKTWQLELLLADCFASIDLIIIGLAIRPLSCGLKSILWGILFTGVRYRNVQLAVGRGRDTWNLPEAALIWKTLFFAGLELIEVDVWRSKFSNLPRTSLVLSLLVLLVIAQVALVRVFGRRLFVARQAALDTARAPLLPIERKEAQKAALVEAEAWKAVLVKAKAHMG